MRHNLALKCKILHFSSAFTLKGTRCLIRRVKEITLYLFTYGTSGQPPLRFKGGDFSYIFLATEMDADSSYIFFATDEHR